MAKHAHLIAIATLFGAVSTAALAQEAQSPDAATEGDIDAQTTATFIGADGSEIGAANLTDVPTGGLIVGVQVEGLPGEQWHAFHFHEGGECDAEGGFESAGGHYNPEDSDHGFYVETGPHAGDMPNQFVPESGVLRAQVFNSRLSLNGNEPSVRGHTIIIHAQQDDYESQPSGDAGDRLACAVIE